MAAPNLTFKNDGSFLEQFRKQASAANAAPPPPMPPASAQPPPPPPQAADPSQAQMMQQQVPQAGYDAQAAYYGYNPYAQMDPSQQMAAGYADPNAYAAYYGYYGMYSGGYAAAAAAAGYQPAGLMNAPAAMPAAPAANVPDYLAGGTPEMMRGQPSRTLWLGNIPPQTSEEDLRNVFSRFGNIESVRMLHHKSCAFVSFGDTKEAAEAWKGNIGLMLHGMSIRIGWGKPEERSESADITGANNAPCRNLWVGNLAQGISEDQLRSVFSPYGGIEAVKVLPAKNCAFVHFHSLEDAQAARSALNGRALADRTMRINYGKESNAPRTTATALAQSASGGAAPWEGGGAGGPGGAPASIPGLGVPPVAAPGSPPPGFALPPNNPDLVKIIDKMVAFIGRNGPLFEESVKVRERDNPKFCFLFGGEGSDYYNWKVYAAKHGLPDNAPPPPGFMPAAAPPPPLPGGVVPPAAAGQPEPPPPQQAPPPHAPPSQHAPSTSRFSAPIPQSQPPSAASHPPPHQHSYPPPPSHYQSSQAPPPPSQPSYPYSAPLPSAAPSSQLPDIPLSRPEEEELEELVARLSGTKESIKSGKDWILARTDKSRAIVRLLVRRMGALENDATKRLHMVYLVNDVLHHSIKKGPDAPPDTFSRALAEGNNLSRLCQAAYAHQPTRTQEQLVKVLNLWADRGIYEAPFITDLISEMKNSATTGKRFREDDREERDRGRGGRWG